MTYEEHYFENLLFHDEDIKGEPNKNALSKEEQATVEICAYYVKYSLLPMIKDEISKLEGGYYPASEYGNEADYLSPYDSGTLFYVQKIIDKYMGSNIK